MVVLIAIGDSVQARVIEEEMSEREGGEFHTGRIRSSGWNEYSTQLLKLNQENVEFRVKWKVMGGLMY